MIFEGSCDIGDWTGTVCPPKNVNCSTLSIQAWMIYFLFTAAGCIVFKINGDESDSTLIKFWWVWHVLRWKLLICANEIWVKDKMISGNWFKFQSVPQHKANVFYRLLLCYGGFTCFFFCFLFGVWQSTVCFYNEERARLTICKTIWKQYEFETIEDEYG